MSSLLWRRWHPALPVVALLASLLLLSSRPAAAQSPPLATTRHDSLPVSRSSRDSAVTRLADAYVDRFVATFPEYATIAGLHEAPADRFADRHPAAVHRWRAFEDSLSAAVEGVPAASLAGASSEATYWQLREAIETAHGQRVCRQELWSINPYSGWQAEWAQLADLQPVDTPAARAAALARWRSAGRYLDVELENLRAGLLAGYTAPAPRVRATLAQIEGLLATPVDSLPFLGPARRDSDAAFRTAFRAAITDSLLPAVRRYRDVVRDEYLPRAKPTVIANPAGLACYRALLRTASGVDRDPEALFAEVAARVQTDSLALLALAAEIYPAPPPGRPRDATWLRDAVERDSANVIPSDSVVVFTEAGMARARAALPRAFLRVPSAEVALVPFPAYQQPTAPGGQYIPPATDGSRPGTYDYRTHPPVRRIGLAAVVVYETWPGHQLQAALAQAAPDAKGLHRRLATLVFFPGFGEGWGQYSEWLADELGVYTTPHDRLGRYATLAPGLLADLGLHLRGWSPDGAVRYLIDARPMAPRERAPLIVQFMTSVPGYFASYTVGALAIERLRAEAERALGDRFDLRVFHDLVLRDGTVPLALVRARVERWVREQSRPAER